MIPDAPDPSGQSKTTSTGALILRWRNFAKELIKWLEYPVHIYPSPGIHTVRVPCLFGVVAEYLCA
jgi:hypothetical protein